jgi:hypothetical protein
VPQLGYSRRPFRPAHASSKLGSPVAALRYGQRLISRSSRFDRERETAAVIFLDTKFVAHAFALICVGTLNECIVHPRDVFRPAIALNSFRSFSFTTILLAIRPGARDRELTVQLRAASNLLMDSTARPRDCRQPQLLREHDPAAVNVFTRRKIQGSRVKVQWKSLVLE